MQRMNVGAMVEEQANHAVRRSGRRAMEGRSTLAIGAVYEQRLGVEHHANGIRIVGIRGCMDGVIGNCGLSWRCATASSANALEELGDLFVSTIACDRDQRLTAELHKIRICARIEKYLHRLGVPLACGEMNRLRIAGQVRIA